MLSTTRSKPSRAGAVPDGTAPAAAPRVVALRMLAARRLTEAQLWTRLERRGYAHEAIAETVDWCKRERYLDDRLFAQLFIDGRLRALGDARLVAELVKRGIDRDAAQESVRTADRPETNRLALAVEKVFRTRPEISYQSAARALERLGFPAHAIYRALRERSRREMPFGPVDAAAEFAEV